MKIPPVVFNLAKCIICLLLFFLSINGILEKQIGPLVRIDHVVEADQIFLKNCMASSIKHFATFSAIKGSLAAIRDSTIFGIALGKIVVPISESVNIIWKFFGLAMLSITLQLSLLKFFQLISFKILFTIGSICYVISCGYIEILKRFAITFMVSSLVLYVMVPYSIYTIKIIFEKNSETVTEELAHDLQSFKEKVDDVNLLSFKNLWPGYAKKEIKRIKISLSKGMDVVISSLLKYLNNLLLMFFLLPLFFYGVIYFVIRKLLESVGVQPVVVVKKY